MPRGSPDTAHLFSSAVRGLSLHISKAPLILPGKDLESVPRDSEYSWKPLDLGVYHLSSGHLAVLPNWMCVLEAAC